MDSSTVTAFPGVGATNQAADAEPDADSDADTAALQQIDAAIALVMSGAAMRVRLTGVPFIEREVGRGLARAGAAGVAFRVEQPERLGVVTVTIGPLEPERAL